MLCTTGLPLTVPFAIPFLALVEVLLFYTFAPRQLAMWLNDDFRVWQTLTATFAHADGLHLTSNVVGMTLGVACEIVHGPLRSATLFLYSAVGGAVGFAAWRALTVGPEFRFYVGASPGVYGLLGSFGSHMVINWRESRLKWLWCTWLCTVLVSEYGMYYTQPVETVAYASHVLGGLHGALLGTRVLRNVVPWRWEKRVQVVAMSTSFLLMAFSLAACHLLLIR